MVAKKKATKKKIAKKSAKKKESSAKEPGSPKSKFDQMKHQLDKLIGNGLGLYYDLAYEYIDDEQKIEIEEIKRKDFKIYYEIWYSEAYQVVKQLLPDRLKDFESCYKDNKRKEIDFLTYSIYDALIGLVTSRGGEEKCNPSAAIPKIMCQVNILQSVKKQFDSLLFHISDVVMYDLFDSELDAAKELSKKGFYRAAGAITGVVLEKHLQKICKNHNLKSAKKNPTINDYNELLKQANVIEIKDWRFIQHLADIRNLCDHNRSQEPEKNDIEDLIKGTEKVIKTIF